MGELTALEMVLVGNDKAPCVEREEVVCGTNFDILQHFT
jgi:hypothetical protein